MQRPNDIRAAVRGRRPLIHCITNPISINQCANAILAVGARPMMAEHPLEVQEITRTADALMLNTGNITDVRMQSMKLALAAAQENGIPVILDAVGAACSTLRREYLTELIGMGGIHVIKGNYSEISALLHSGYRSPGVDADEALQTDDMRRIACDTALMYGAAVLASGKTDVISDGKTTADVRNGTPQLSTVTGTGCMLGALCGAYLSAAPAFDAAAAACAVMGICGQLAETGNGSGSFMTGLMDVLSTLTDADTEGLIDMEVYLSEKL